MRYKYNSATSSSTEQWREELNNESTKGGFIRHNDVKIKKLKGQAFYYRGLPFLKTRTKGLQSGTWADFNSKEYLSFTPLKNT